MRVHRRRPSPAITTSAPAFSRRRDPVRRRRRAGQHQGRHERRGEQRQGEVQVQPGADHGDRRRGALPGGRRAGRRRPPARGPAGTPPDVPSPRPPRPRPPARAACRRSACPPRTEMGCERPSCWAAPSSEETMLARSHTSPPREPPDGPPEGPSEGPGPGYAYASASSSTLHGAGGPTPRTAAGSGHQRYGGTDVAWGAVWHAPDDAHRRPRPRRAGTAADGSRDAGRPKPALRPRVAEARPGRVLRRTLRRGTPGGS